MNQQVAGPTWRLVEHGVMRMRGRKKWLNFGFIALVLALALTACGPTPMIIIDNNLTYRQREQLEMVPEPSGQSTNESLWMDMQGGG
jgi:hypothetical protein